MANDREDQFDENDPNRKPRLSDGREHLGDEFVRPVPREDRELGDEFTERNTYDGKRLGEEFTDTSYSGDREMGRVFADPNSMDDTRLGKDFEKTNSSARKHHRPVGQVVSEPFTKPKNKKVLFIVVGVILLVFLLVLFFGWIPRHDRNKKTQDLAQQANQPAMIEVVKVTRSQNQAGLVVPGTTTPLTESSVYARANGYLKKRFVDIGDHVVKGQLLAIVDAPDLDAEVAQARQQVNQAESQLAQQETQLALTKVTVDRYRVLVAKGVFSRQDGDQREADYQAQVANVTAAERNVEAFRANLNHEIALQSYERITAPFSGVITQRNVDNGDLISSSGSSGGTPPTTMGAGTTTGQSANAGTNSYGSSGMGPNYATPGTGTGTNGGALFTIAQNDRLRILVSVPEGYVSSIRVGGKAMLHFQEFPTETFYGDVTRTAGSIDQNTRTMITEIQVDNHAGHLLPGMYAVATFEGATGPGPLVISGDAIAIRNNTTTCAVIANGKVRLVPVVLGRDFGPVTEIVSGLKDGDIIASTFTDEVKPGIPVRTHLSDSAQQATKAPVEGVKPLPPGGSTSYGDPGIEDEDMQGQSAKPGQKQAQGASKSNGKGESKP